MSKIKESIQKERLRLTSHTLKIYNEKFLKGEIPNPVEVLVEVMTNAPRDSDKINAAKELKSLFFIKAPTESEVTIQDDRSTAEMTKEEYREYMNDKLQSLIDKNPAFKHLKESEGDDE